MPPSGLKRDSSPRTKYCPLLTHPMQVYRPHCQARLIEYVDQVARNGTLSSEQRPFLGMRLSKRRHMGGCPAAPCTPSNAIAIVGKANADPRSATICVASHHAEFPYAVYTRQVRSSSRKDL